MIITREGVRHLISYRSCKQVYHEIPMQPTSACVCTCVCVSENSVSPHFSFKFTFFLSSSSSSSFHVHRFLLPSCFPASTRQQQAFAYMRTNIRACSLCASAVCATTPCVCVCVCVCVGRLGVTNLHQPPPTAPVCVFTSGG